ncbi:heterokaryon incompatibility protein-domain-containing protein [Aspergillus carlsbadensis]|nr:heterokaryon incompatibility protein-domain-containing protein [Aspergillus carlsbadensis]
MAAILPLRVIHRKVKKITDDKGKPRKVTGFSVEDPHRLAVQRFDIVSYRWGQKVEPWSCAERSEDWDGLLGVTWRIKVTKAKMKELLRLMEEADIEFLWADCVCVDQENEAEKSAEIGRMYEYYKSADRCHIIINMDDVLDPPNTHKSETKGQNQDQKGEGLENNAETSSGATVRHSSVWNPQAIVDDLKFLDHVLHHTVIAAVATDALLTPHVVEQLSAWETAPWLFQISQMAVRAAAVEPGIVNCYATCVKHVRSLFRNLYFSRVWTFQEMLLGKNITMWGVDLSVMECIGQFDTWMDLAVDASDKAAKLSQWIDDGRVFRTNGINAILQVIEEDQVALSFLRTQVQGISSARTDIIAGGPRWWQDNHKGISNVFSAISIWPRTCEERADIFKGLLGLGLAGGSEEIEAIAFAFFRQLSLRTDRAWTRLAISSGRRGGWDWIPMVSNPTHITTTDVFAGVVELGSLTPDGRVKTRGITGLQGTPRPYVKFQPRQEAKGMGFRFVFQGCNAGKTVKTSTFKSEAILVHTQMRDVAADETGRILVQLSTIMGALLDPMGDVVEYRRRLLGKLQPRWRVTDPNAKPVGWIDRCVSGTPWENPAFEHIRAHNRSMSYNIAALHHCQSRLCNESTEDISCEIRINCGCTIVAPFYFALEAIIAVHGSFLGKTSVGLDKDNRIILQDGVGLVQPGDVGRGFHIVAFEGDIHAHRAYASSCRNTKKGKPVLSTVSWPRGRAIVRDEFSHAATDVMRDYGYIQTGGYVQGDGYIQSGGSGNLLLCRNHPLGDYRIVGVCIDNFIENSKGEKRVVIN